MQLILLPCTGPVVNSETPSSAQRDIMFRSLSNFILLGNLAYACQTDWDALSQRSYHYQKHNRHAKRTEVEYPPTLSETESILVNSFDNKSISDWSYYYTHGDHLGSHNKSMAEWTAQKWRDAGFDAWLEDFPIWVTYPEVGCSTTISSFVRLTLCSIAA